MGVEKISLKLFIASSSEVKAERDRSVLILFLLNKAFPHLHLEPVMWEHDLPKSSQPHFNSLQDAINEKLKECKLAAFIFYSKLGQYTKEEFQYTMQKELPSFIFFKSPSAQAITSSTDYRQLQEFRDALENKVSPIDYTSLMEFEYEFYKNLNVYLAQKYASQQGLRLTIQELQETLSQQQKVKEKLEKQLEREEHNDKLKDQALSEMREGKYDVAESHLKESAKSQIQKTASTFIQLGQLKEVQLLYKEAYDNYELAVKIEPDNTTYLKAAGVIASTYLGLYDKAKEYYEKALDLDRTRNDFDEIPKSMNNLAQVYSHKGDYHSALVYSTQLIEFIERNRIIATSDTAGYYSIHGHIQTELENFDEAIKYYNLALEKGNAFFSADASQLAVIVNGLGNVHFRMGNYLESIEYYHKAMSTSINRYGENNLNVMVQYTNLGRCYNELDQSSLAIEYLEKALTIADQLFPQKNQRYISIYNTYGSLFNRLGKYDEAIKYLHQALNLIEEFSMKDHPDSYETYTELATAWSNKGNHVKELEYLAKALATSQTSGKDALIAALYYSIASTHLKMQQYNLAIESYEKALAIWQKDFETNVSNIQIAYFYLGFAYYERKQYRNAIEYFQNALQICIQTIGHHNADTLECYYYLGQCFYFDKQYAISIEYYQKALDNRLQVDKKITGLIGIYHNNIGKAWYMLKEHNKASEHYHLALPILKEFFPPGDSNIKTCEKNLEEALKARTNK